MQEPEQKNCSKSFVQVSGLSEATLRNKLSLKPQLDGPEVGIQVRGCLST